MNRRMIIRSLGFSLLILGATMLFSLAFGLYYGDAGRFPLLWSAAVTAGVGGLLTKVKPERYTLDIKEGFILTAFVWIFSSIFGALPFVLSGAIPNVLNALFETVSGFTTTGSTILSEIESLPPSILMWRSFTHFIGGMGVLVFVVAILPRGRDNDSHSINVLKAEVPGEFGKLTSRLANTARALYAIYVGMTLVLTVILLIAGMNLFDALTTSFATAGTGGFSPHNASIAYFNSPTIEWILTFGMLAFGVNFNLYYAKLMTGGRIFTKSREFMRYVEIFLGACLLMALKNLSLVGNFLTSLRDSAFTAASVMTTTGFITVDFEAWPTFSKGILLMLMFIGACAGSTGGGIKVGRIVVLGKAALAEIKRIIHPHRIVAVRDETGVLTSEKLRSVLSYFVLYIFVFAISFLLVTWEGKDLITSFTAVATTMNNVGPGLELVGPVQNFAHFGDFTKIVLIIDMLAGRLELIPILVFFVPEAWFRN